MIKAGILGGGQLGRMLLQAAANYPVVMYVMEKDADCPSAAYCNNFTIGDITNYDDVYAFGKKVDVLTIEIENVNVDALEKLEAEGLLIIPNTNALRTIKNKQLQKKFYKDNGLPTSEFINTQNKEDAANHKDLFPAVHKLAEGGYDGKGVVIINNESELDNAFDAPAVLEKKIDIVKELAITVAFSTSGETAIYSPVDMIFDNDLNLLSHQISPADIPENVFWKAEAIALQLVKKLASPGLFAVELFSDADGHVWVNETAPRVHNSGHHTIEACYSSQFDMLLRIMLGYPLGNTAHRSPAAIVNIVGAKDFNGEANYKGLEEVLAMDNVFVHIYGKAYTKPGRKMGHVTIVSNEKQELIHKVNQIKNLLQVVSQ